MGKLQKKKKQKKKEKDRYEQRILGEGEDWLLGTIRDIMTKNQQRAS